MLTYPNLLIIAGTGRNSGKTTLACAIISKFKDQMPIGIKISPHFHETSESLQLIKNQAKYRIFREVSSKSGKDSSRMLDAGASESYYIQVLDHNLEEAFTETMKFIDDNKPIICESPILASKVNSDVLLISDSDKIVNKKNLGELFEQADRTIMFGNAQKEIESLIYNDQKWQIS